MAMTKPRFAWRFSDDGVLSNDSGYGAGLTIPFIANGVLRTALVQTPTSRGSVEGGYILHRDNGAADLVDAVQDAMDAVAPETITCGIYLDTANYGKFFATTNVGNIEFRWQAVAHTFPETALGFTANTNVGGTSFEVAAQSFPQRSWAPSQVARDERERPRAITEMFESTGGVRHAQRFDSSNIRTRRVLLEFLTAAETLTADANATVAGTNNSFEALWEWLARGERVEYFADWTDNSTDPADGTYVLQDPAHMQALEAVATIMEEVGVERHRVNLLLREYLSP